MLKSLDDLLEKIENAEEGGFEQPHQELGEWLGYKSLNPSGSGAPDPIWVLDACSCVVAEDKIYSALDKTIPLKHVDEAKRHEGWVRRNDQLHLNVDAEVTTVFLTTATKIDEEARANAEGLWYVEREINLQNGPHKRLGFFGITFCKKRIRTMIRILKQT